MLDTDRALGALLGLAVGDALGAPVDGLSHQNVRTYYRGIKGYTADERRGLAAGQWTAHTQRAFALTRLLAEEAPAADLGWGERLVSGLDRLLDGAALRRRPPEPWGTRATAAVCAVPFGLWAHAVGASSEQLAAVLHAVLWKHAASLPALAAANGMAAAVDIALDDYLDPADGDAFFADTVVLVEWFENDSGMGIPVSTRLHKLRDHLDEFPLDLQDRCNGTGDAADEAFPFALAMVARGPELIEATLLSAVNVGGAASAVGAMAGALLGALHGWSAFPAEWREGLEDAARLEAEARALVAALGGG